MNFEKFKDYVSKNINTLYKKANSEEKHLLDLMVNYINKMAKKEITLTNYLKEQINNCDGYIDTIKSDIQKISYGGRSAGKTYLANQIIKNETAKKCYKEILSKIEKEQ